MLKKIQFLGLLLISISAGAATFINAPYRVCFTPAQSCATYVVAAINDAKQRVEVQAYSFTSKSILAALKNAHDRGVDVRVILDKGQYSKSGKYTSATFLTHAGISVWIDNTVAIAHNKVMVLDDAEVITGSFNFTRAADERNAENLLVITDRGLAKKYKQNWVTRMKKSQKLN